MVSIACAIRCATSRFAVSNPRERALAYGGELQAGPLPEGGWRVHMRLRPGGERQ